MADILPITHSAVLSLNRDAALESFINSTILPITFQNILNNVPLDLTGPNPYV